MMEIGRRVVTHRGQVVGLEESEHLECSDPLTIRWELPQFAIVGRDRERLDPFRSVIREVIAGQETTELLYMLGDPLTERSAIEQIGTRVADRLHRLREVRIREPLTSLRRSLPVDQIGIARARIPLQIALEKRPLAGGGSGYGEAFFSQKLRHMYGSTTFSTAAAVTAASTALPPC